MECILANFEKGLLELRYMVLTYAGLVLTPYDAGPDGWYIGSIVMQREGLYVKHRRYG
jgi:hypothetical protein